MAVLFCHFATILCAQTRPRSAGFFGFHYDHHASLTDTIGGNLTPALLDSLLTLTKPDYLQVGCKGHFGISSYPTKIGVPTNVIRQDMLKMYRDVTRKHGIPLAVHFSGVWDEAAVVRHPDWARVDETGQPDKRKISLVGPYAARCFVPQLRELVEEYGIDAVWVDGDSWAVEPDYAPAMQALFLKESGRKAPVSRQDSLYPAWMDFNRRQFRQYLRRYTDTLHRHHPNFEICSNFAYSARMPEPPEAGIDFLSGDISPVNSLNRAAFFARCFAPQDKPWDLMAWSNRRNWDAAHAGGLAEKSLVQLQQEAAQVIALGGGFQSYWKQNTDASIRAYTFSRMAALARFCRARELFCHRAEIIPQVGLLYSTSAFFKASTAVYSDDSTHAIQGALAMLMDAGIPVDILMEYQLDQKLEQYPLLVVPEWRDIDQAVLAKLEAYVRRGGRLLVLGGRAVKDFRELLGVAFEKPAFELGPFQGYALVTDLISGLRGYFQPVRPGTNTRTIGKIYLSPDLRTRAWPLATIRPLDKGQIAGIYADIASAQHRGFQSAILTNVLKTVVEQLLPQPFVQVSGSAAVHVVAARKNGRRYVHLLNAGGPHRDPNVFNYETIPPLPPLRLRISLPEKPRKIVLQPENRPLKFRWKKGVAALQTPPVEIYGILEIID